MRFVVEGGLSVGQVQRELRDLVRLGEDRDASLHEDVVLRHVGGLLGHIHVADAGVRRADVRVLRVDVVDGQ